MSEEATGEIATASGPTSDEVGEAQTSEAVVTSPEDSEAINATTTEAVDANPKIIANEEKKETHIANSIVSEYDALITWVTDRLSVLGLDQTDNGESKTNYMDSSMGKVIVEFITGEGKSVLLLQFR